MRGFAWRLNWDGEVLASRPYGCMLTPIAKYCPPETMWERMNGAGEWLPVMTVDEWRKKVSVIRALYFPNNIAGGVDIRPYHREIKIYEKWRKAKNAKPRNERNPIYTLVEYDGGKRVAGSEEEFFPDVDRPDTHGYIELRESHRRARARSPAYRHVTTEDPESAGATITPEEFMKLRKEEER